MSDQTYIDNIKSQVASGMYDHLFKGRNDLVFLDIGANVGIVSIYAVPYCKRIVAVEPAPATFDILKRNTANYQIIECLEVALTPHDGTHLFFMNDINFTASSTVNTYGEQTIVNGISLMELLLRHRLEHVDVCKIDCEGCEEESLTLERIAWAKSRIDTYYIETHNCPK